MGLTDPLPSEQSVKGAVSEWKESSYLLKCFLLTAFNFWETGVTRLSVGEMYAGLLEKRKSSTKAVCICSSM